MISSTLSAIIFAAILATSLGAATEEREADGEINCCKGRCKNYRGKMSTTVSGLKCQKWDSNYPHQPYFNSTRNPNAGLEENFCRNPSYSGAAWCYTTSKAKRWEHCAVPKCESASPKKVEAGSDCCKGNCKNYRGKMSTTVSGFKCQKWDSNYPHQPRFNSTKNPNAGLEENFCRNPSYSGAAWCYTTSKAKKWEHCAVPKCESASPKKVEAGLDCCKGNCKSYRGKMSTTVSGFKCQNWASNYPHPTRFNPKKNPDAGLEENFCRNPSYSSAAWCYTTSKAKRWEHCAVPKCESESPRKEEAGSDCCIGNCKNYRGTLSKTITGHDCRRWDSIIRNKQPYLLMYYPYAGLEENYCRNPKKAGRAWCFTTRKGRKWEYCDVPQCS